MSAETPRRSRSWQVLRRVVHSFRFRLTLLFVAILAVILAGFSIFIYTRQAQILRVETVNRLQAQSAQLEAYYRAQLRSFEEDREDPPIGIPAGELPLLPESTLLALIGPDGKIIQQQGMLSPVVVSSLIKNWSESPAQLQPLVFTVPGQEGAEVAAGEPYVFQITPLAVEGGWAGLILLGSQVDPTGQLQALAVSLVLTSLLILLVAFASGYWLADRAMKPVQTIVRTARRISENDLSQRLDLHRADELGELAETFDQMLDRLQAAFERQRQFTADASHELRSPLAIIELESNRALERKRAPEEYEKVLRLIQSENAWMGDLVNELLLLARLDAGQAALRAEKLDLSDVVVDVTERLNPLAQSSGILLKTGSLAECFVQADRVYLAQLLNNLVENAIKYTRGKGDQVLVESASQEMDGKQWSLVRISDNGPGIPEEHLPYIFNRFYRLDAARTRPVEAGEAQVSGSGLGLAIAQTIVQAYGGRIEAGSQVGRGTVFTVWLPAA